MKKLFKGLVTVMACSFLFSVGGCGQKADTSTQESAPTESVESTLKEPETLETVTLNVAENVTSSNQQARAFRQIGRTYINESNTKVLRCDLTCTGVAFNAICKGEVKVKFWTETNCYFTIYIDGVRVAERLFVSAEDSNSFITVANFADYGEREIRLVKQTQYAFTYSGIVEVQMQGAFGKRPKQKERFIEYYGDSILNGSNIYTGGTSVTSTDGTYAFGYMSALALNADCNIIGRGGMGLYNKDSSTEGMNQIWNLNSSSKATGVTEYDFGRIPDVVVVELGCNDVLSNYYTDARYIESIQVMVNNIRSAYGDDMRIVWCYGFNEQMDEKWATVVKPTLDSLNAGGTIYYCQLPLAGLSKDKGGDGLHPNVEMSKDMADALTAFIEQNIYA